MVHTNIKAIQRERGFTIVELLIVIVVIGILATITIISYANVTTRANTAKSQTNAETAQKVAESINADTGSYPITAAAFATGSTSTKLPSGMTVGFATETASLTNVSWECSPSCTSAITGGRIGWWSYSAPVGINYVTVGSPSPATPTYAFPAS